MEGINIAPKSKLRLIDRIFSPPSVLGIFYNESFCNQLREREIFSRSINRESVLKFTVILLKPYVVILSVLQGG